MGDALALRADHQRHRASEIRRKRILAVHGRADHPHAFLLQLVDRAVQVLHPGDGQVVQRPRCGLRRRRAKPRRPPLRQDHAVGPRALRRADDRAQVVGVGHAVQYDDERLLAALLRKGEHVVHALVVHRRHVGQHALMGRIDLIQAAAIHRLHHGAGVPGHADDVLRCAGQVALGHQQLLHRAAGFERLADGIASHQQVLVLLRIHPGIGLHFRIHDRIDLRPAGCGGRVFTHILRVHALRPGHVLIDRAHTGACAAGLSTAISGVSTIPLRPSTATSGVSTVPLRLSTAISGVSTVRIGFPTATSGVSTVRIGLSTASGGVSAIRIGFPTAISGVSTIPLRLSTASGSVSAVPLRFSTATSGVSTVPLRLSTAIGGVSAVRIGFPTATSGKFAVLPQRIGSAGRALHIPVPAICALAAIIISHGHPPYPPPEAPSGAIHPCAPSDR